MIGHASQRDGVSSAPRDGGDGPALAVQRPDRLIRRLPAHLALGGVLPGRCGWVWRWHGHRHGAVHPQWVQAEARSPLRQLRQPAA
jgi:hypothetical protein